MTLSAKQLFLLQKTHLVASLSEIKYGDSSNSRDSCWISLQVSLLTLSLYSDIHSVYYQRTIHDKINAKETFKELEIFTAGHETSQVNREVESCELNSHIKSLPQEFVLTK